MFGEAKGHNGFDAWRRVIIVGQSSAPLHLEDLREEVFVIIRKKIMDLEVMPVGIADFERTIK